MRNPIARVVTQLRPKVKPSKKVYSRMDEHKEVESLKHELHEHEHDENAHGLKKVRKSMLEEAHHAAEESRHEDKTYRSHDPVYKDQHKDRG